MIKSFDEVFEDATKLGVKIKTDEYHPIGKYQIIDQGQEAVAGYSDLEDGVFENVPAIVFGDHTRIVKYVDQPFFLGADGVKVLRSRFKDANYRYLYYALKSVKIPNTGYNRHFKWLKEAKIYYPNSEEQSKIVLILDGISSVIEHRQQELQKLDELVKARFVEMFGDVIRNSKSWEIRVLADIASSRLGKMLDTKQQTGECSYPYLANFNVQWFRFNTENLNQMDLTKKIGLNLNCRMATFWYARAVKLGVAPCGIMKYSPAFSRRLFTGYGVIVKLFTQIIWGGGLNTIVIMMGLRLLLEQKLP